MVDNADWKRVLGAIDLIRALAITWRYVTLLGTSALIGIPSSLWASAFFQSQLTPEAR
jgi:hypothetical protein